MFCFLSQLLSLIIFVIDTIIDVLGVGAVKGPCAVFIFFFSVFFLSLGGVGGLGGDVNVLCDC